jgi:ApaG protein
MAKYEFTVSAQPRFLPQHSDPEASRFVFAYTIRIVNTGDVAAKLLSRHWIITDSHEHVEEVRGEGVVGEQPHLAPGAAYEYTSGCPLETPVGTMRGSYQCVADDGTRFEAPIPEFVLAMASALH